MKNVILTLFAIGSVTSAQFIQAEITEIPPEEMTEAYIKDTTVIIRKQKVQPQSKQNTSVIRVSPLEDDFSEGESTRAHVTAPATELPSEQRYLGEHHQAELLNQVAYSFRGPAADENKEIRDDALRAALNLQPGEPIDYNTLSFPSTIPTGVIAPLDTSVSTQPGSFVLSIPNTGNYAPTSFSTPGGEYDVNITPERINFGINVPNQ